MSWADPLDADNYITFVFEFNGISDGNSNEELNLLRVSGLMVVLVEWPTINIHYSSLTSKYIELWLNLKYKQFMLH